jgi:hypothetical protein
MVSSPSAAAQAAENDKRRKPQHTMEKAKANHVCHQVSSTLKKILIIFAVLIALSLAYQTAPSATAIRSTESRARLGMSFFFWPRIFLESHFMHSIFSKNKT